jgi:hypothetical protein
MDFYLLGEYSIKFLGVKGAVDQHLAVGRVELAVGILLDSDWLIVLVHPSFFNLINYNFPNRIP